MHRTRRKRLSSVCLASCAASLLLAAPTQATEYGFGDYGLGYGIPMSGYTPAPGVYFSDSFYLYSGSASKNLSFPFGRLTAIGITANLITNIAAVAWYTDVKIFGGTLGFAAAIPYGSDTNSAAVSFIGPLGFNRQLNPRKTVAAIGIRPIARASAGKRASIIGMRHLPVLRLPESITPTVLPLWD